MCVRMAKTDKDTKETIKGLKQDKTKLIKKVEGLKLELKAKSKAVDDAMTDKNKLESELQKLKDQLQSSLSQA